MNSAIVVAKQQQALNQVERSIHAEFVVEKRLSLTLGMISQGSIDSEREVRIGHVLSPIESNRLARMLSIKVNVAECSGNFFGLCLLGDRVKIERSGCIKVGIRNELIHYGVV